MIKKTLITLAVILATAPLGFAQQRLTQHECRQMALAWNKDLEQSRTKVDMAGYDRKTALANYFPNISATGLYTHNSKNISLIDNTASATLNNLGTAAQSGLSNMIQQIMAAVQSNPSAAQEYTQSAMWQTFLGALSQSDISAALNAVGQELDKALHLDVQDVFVGAISLQEPVFAGGKIRTANRIARLAEDLAKAQYDLQFQQTILDVDQAYWQIVSVSAKKALAESYADLLHKMEKDVEISLAEGVLTESDALSIKVKANEADMMLTKVASGDKLSRMLLCKLIGLDLQSNIVLADEGLDRIPTPQIGPRKDISQIIADRPELRSLELATKIYDGKARIAKANMMPIVAVTANYLISNPSCFNGFENKFGGMWNAGVAVNIPIFHGFESLQKTRKAKAEANIYRSKLEDAKNMVNLQVTQLRQHQDEALEKVAMAENNLKHAEENLRVATVGFENGVVTTNTALSAQTAWLKAHSEYIDAGIELQMTNSSLAKAEGITRR